MKNTTTRTVNLATGWWDGTSIVLAFVLVVGMLWSCLCCCSSRRRRASTNADHLQRTLTAPPWLSLDQKAINSLPTVLYEGVSSSSSSSSSMGCGEGGIMQCAICLGRFEEKAIVRVLPECNHGFHKECIDRWLASRTTCPLCRSLVMPPVTPVDEDGPPPPPSSSAAEQSRLKEWWRRCRFAISRTFVGVHDGDEENR